MIFARGNHLCRLIVSFGPLLQRLRLGRLVCEPITEAAATTPQFAAHRQQRGFSCGGAGNFLWRQRRMAFLGGGVELKRDDGDGW